MSYVTPTDGWSDAVRFALKWHGEALRKRTRVPYVTHVVAVAETLAYYYPERDALVTAGLLHDVVEDTEVSFEQVAASFGTAVMALVRAVSKDDEAMQISTGTTLAEIRRGLDEESARAAVWRARRAFMLSHVRAPGVPRDVLRLKAADAHANLVAVLRDLRNPRIGTAVWDRFKVGRDDSIGFYQAILDAVRAGFFSGAEGEPSPSDAALVRDLDRVLAEVSASGAA